MRSPIEDPRTPIHNSMAMHLRVSLAFNILSPSWLLEGHIWIDNLQVRVQLHSKTSSLVKSSFKAKSINVFEVCPDMKHQKWWKVAHGGQFCDYIGLQSNFCIGYPMAPIWIQISIGDYPDPDFTYTTKMTKTITALKH